METRYQKDKKWKSSFQFWSQQDIHVRIADEDGHNKALEKYLALRAKTLKADVRQGEE
jgi:hypothetical protein